jgi:hypothetical protein
MTFLADGRTYGKNDFLEGEGGLLTFRGSYIVQGSVIYHTVEGRTTKLHYRIEGDNMHLKIAEEDSECSLRRIITEPDGATNGSQPIRSETNSTSAAAGYRR